MFQDPWRPVVKAILNKRKFHWLKQRMTGSRCDTLLLQKIVDFVMYEHPIDIEKLRKSLHYQVSISCLIVYVTKLEHLLVHVFGWMYPHI